MNRTTFLSCLAMPLLLSTFALTEAHAQDMAAEESTVTFRCEGMSGTCFTLPGEGVTIAGRLVEIDRGGDRRVCQDAGGNIASIFMHNPDDPSTGKGYIGVRGCLEPIDGEREISVQRGAQVYHTLREWKAAQEGIRVE